MSEIDRIVEQMPRAKRIGILHKPDTDDVWNEACGRQCRLLAKQGWRKVPSEDGCRDILLDVVGTTIHGGVAFDVGEAKKMLRRWLMEGE